MRKRFIEYDLSADVRRRNSTQIGNGMQYRIRLAYPVRLSVGDMVTRPSVRSTEKKLSGSFCHLHLRSLRDTGGHARSQSPVLKPGLIEQGCRCDGSVLTGTDVEHQRFAVYWQPGGIDAQRTIRRERGLSDGVVEDRIRQHQSRFPDFERSGKIDAVVRVIPVLRFFLGSQCRIDFPSAETRPHYTERMVNMNRAVGIFEQSGAAHGLRERRAFCGRIAQLQATGADRRG